MNEEIVAGLSECFDCFPDNMVRNLKWHVDNETPIFVGDASVGAYTSPEGFG